MNFVKVVVGVSLKIGFVYVGFVVIGFSLLVERSIRKRGIKCIG